jgi:hypothetical protein
MFLISQKTKVLLSRLGSVASIIFSICFWAGVIGLFFVNRYPFIEPFVMWCLKIIVGVFLAFTASMIVIAPGYLLAKDLNDGFSNPYQSSLDRKLILIWSIGAGILFSLLIATAITLIILGYISDIKVWFIGLCWTVLAIPWAILGFIVRYFLLSINRRKK